MSTRRKLTSIRIPRGLRLYQRDVTAQGGVREVPITTVGKRREAELDMTQGQVVMALNKKNARRKLGLA